MAKERPRGSGGHSAIMRSFLAIVVCGIFAPSFLAPQPERSLRSNRLQRRATEVEEVTETKTADPVEKLCAMLPLVTGRKNHTEEDLFEVVGTKVGTSVELKLPQLSYWQYVRGQGKKLRTRALPTFNSNADSLAAAKEKAAAAALSALFRPLVTRLSSRNNQGLAQAVASIFKEDVEVAQVRFEGEVDEKQKSPGNFLYTLAYLSRQTYEAGGSKRMLTASHVNRLPAKPSWLQVLVQQKQRLVMPQNVAVESVSADTEPNNLAAYMEKALRDKGALKLQLAGTQAAEQALLALQQLNLYFKHRFSCYFMHGDFQNATGIEVHVSRRWQPLT